MRNQKTLNMIRNFGIMALVASVAGLYSGALSAGAQMQQDRDTGQLQQSDIRRMCEDMARRVFQEGVPITSEVRNVYPGMGFTIDMEGRQVFVRHTEEMPQEGETVTVTGVLRSAVDEQGNVRLDPAPGENLRNFLQQQPVYLEAREVEMQPRANNDDRDVFFRQNN